MNHYQKFFRVPSRRNTLNLLWQVKKKIGRTRRMKRKTMPPLRRPLPVLPLSHYLLEAAPVSSRPLSRSNRTTCCQDQRCVCVCVYSLYVEVSSERLSHSVFYICSLVGVGWKGWLCPHAAISWSNKPSDRPAGSSLHWHWYITNTVVTIDEQKSRPGFTPVISIWLLPLRLCLWLFSRYKVCFLYHSL